MTDAVGSPSEPRSGSEPLSTPPPAPPKPTLATLPLTLLIQAAASAATIAPAVAAPALLARLQVGSVAVGLYIALVYAAAMVSSQWGAPLVRRWGPIRASQVALLFSAAGVLLASVPSLPVAALGAVLLGLGYGPITPASSEILARTTPLERYALVFSVKQTGVPAGGVIAGVLVPGVLEWAGPFWALAQIGALCLVGASLAAVLRGGLDHHRDPAAPLPTFAHALQPMRFVWSHPVLRTLALCSFVMSIVQVCLTSYLVTFLNHDLRWTLVAAGAALAAAQVGGVVGRVLWGVIADRRGEARNVLLALVVGMALCGFAMPWLAPGMPHAPIVALMVVFGATGIGWNGVYLATIARVVSVENATPATSGSLFFTYFGVVVGPPLFGTVGGLFGALGPSFALLGVPLVWVLWRLSRWRSAPV